MKITRKLLLRIIICLGILLLAYSFIRHFTNFALDENIEKYFINGIIIASIIIFFYNRKLYNEEMQAKAAKEEKEKRQTEIPAEEIPADETQDDENLPHWERKDYNRDARDVSSKKLTMRP